MLRARHLVRLGFALGLALVAGKNMTQTRLLNAQNGKAETVRIGRAGSGPVDVRGRSVPATRWRIEGTPQPIDVWYSAQGEWVGLDSMLEGGRALVYRLK